VTSGRKWLLAAAALVVAAQLVPVPRTNPPVVADVDASPEVKAILRRACYDCHSHETVWGPQAFVAPVSWLVAYDVVKGRDELNFSRWGERRRPAKLGKKIREEVGEGAMPPWRYTVAHPDARLSADDRRAVVAWAASLGVSDARGERTDPGGAERKDEDGEEHGRRRRGGR
jgi:hypothetical protein